MQMATRWQIDGVTQTAPDCKTRQKIEQLE